ncbi:MULTISPECIES: lysophospholipid transporter LplT [Candidatus Ichthyocystis]|uniref:lysophospholipid transporter LplT n=1 Tax=Candidatus Ichthyocystis TaxID=2929841 RepID=UPI000A83C534|nr:MULTISPECIES: lysophospholipid transporter LplT [Ichthyocystis]
MGYAFYFLMITQFLSSLADNAIMLVIIDLFHITDSPEWVTPLLKFFFVVPYVLLASWIGPVSDRIYKNQLMMITNCIKAAGCIMLFYLLLSSNKSWKLILLSYTVIGVGAACYSPAKYGIIAELVGEDLLVKANAWVETLTVASIILGSILGGVMVSKNFSNHAIVQSLLSTFEGENKAAQLATLVLFVVYLISFSFNLFIPKTNSSSAHTSSHKVGYMESVKTLSSDRLGRLSLLVTTLFWGVGAILQFLLIVWGEQNLNFSISQTAYLQSVFAIGIGVGSVISSKIVTLEKIDNIMIVGLIGSLFIGLLVIIKSVFIAIPYLIMVGAMVGFFIVPMNALLQARGYLLVGSGKSIAIQNMCENIGVLIMLAIYSLLLHCNVSASSIILLLGLSTSACVLYLMKNKQDANKL